MLELFVSHCVLLELLEKGRAMYVSRSCCSAVELRNLLDLVTVRAAGFLRDVREEEAKV